MNLSIGLGVATSYLPIPAVALDPDAVIAALFSSGEEGAWYDPSDSATVWQDAAGTTPATVGDPVGRIDDKSGNGNHATQTTSAARPVLQQSGGLYYLDFDGVDDWMGEVVLSSSVTRPFTHSIAAQWTGVGTTSSNEYLFDTEAANRLGIYRGTVGDAFVLIPSVVNTGSAPLGSDYVFVSDIKSVNSSIRRNGSVVGTGNSSSTIAKFRLANYFGGSGSGQYYLEGRIYGMVLVDRTLTAGEISDLESYLADKSGVTL